MSSNDADTITKRNSAEERYKMAGLTREQKLSDVNTKSEDLFVMFSSLQKDATQRENIAHIFRHPNCPTVIANVAFLQKKYAFHKEAVGATNKDVVEVVRKETAIPNSVIFEHGSVEVLTACIDRFTMQDLSAFLANKNGAALQSVVLAKVSDLAGNDLGALLQLLQAKDFVAAMQTPDQKVMLGLILENATDLFQKVIDNVAAQVNGPEVESQPSNDSPDVAADSSDVTAS